jgi:di/tricarboxylate transporter
MALIFLRFKSCGGGGACQECSLDVLCMVIIGSIMGFQGSIAMQQIIFFATVIVMLALFILGKWRYDLVALTALLFLVVVGIIPASEAFLGLGHPAVVTAAAVLVMSRGLANAGVVDAITGWLANIEHPRRQMAVLIGMLTACSAFMNNIGALALFMPVGMQMARKRGFSPSNLLMPMAFASILGGLITLIGTPLNIIIATFREDAVGTPFRVFDFAPVGLPVAVAGLLFMILFGWRLLPRREATVSRKDLFNIEDFTAEVRVLPDSRLVGRPLREVGLITDADTLVAGIVRGEERLAAPSSFFMIKADDVLIIQASTEDLETLINVAGLSLEGVDQGLGEEVLSSDEVSVIEAVVMPDSSIQSKTVRDINLRKRYGVNLLGIARQGQRLSERLVSTEFDAGDVLLLQGELKNLAHVRQTLGVLPLGERRLRLSQPQQLLVTSVVVALGLGLAAVGVLPVQIAIVAVAIVLVFLGSMSLREAYESIEWHILVLLGALISIGHALETTGGAELLADQLLAVSQLVPPEVMVTLILITSMLLANMINNKAAAVLVAPIAISVARGLGASVDPFLIAVALGAEFVFLSPVGHKSNILVMGAGGYQFSDYWRLGVPLTIVALVVAAPLLLLFWPL